MRVIPLAEFQSDPKKYQETEAVLEKGGLICFPSLTGYKLAADFNSPSAVISMIQAKRRVKNAPALVFILKKSWINKVAANVSDEARVLMEALWPGPMTLLFEPSEDVHPKVRKALTKAKGWLGVRLPGDDVAIGVIKAFGNPILVSSANLANKGGSHSVAQVRKNFGRTVDLLIDSGDLSDGPRSTLIDLTKGRPSIIRTGIISEETIQQALAG